MEADFEIHNFIFDPRPHYPLLMTAKRYRPRKRVLFPSTTTSTDTSTGPLTLIFAHGAGFHKEQFEATIEDLWKHVVSNANEGGENLKESKEIREIWSLDCPNHGDAAILNEHAVMYGYDSFFSWEDYAYMLYLLFAHHGTLYTVASFPRTSAEAEQTLLSSPPSNSTSSSSLSPLSQHHEIYTPTHPYFASHNLVGVGHSMAATAFLLTMTYPSTSTFPTLPFPSSSSPLLPPTTSTRLPYTSLILVDPMLIPRALETRMGRGLEQGSSTRRDTWSSRAEAFEALYGRKKGGWAKWDGRVLKAFCETGLRDLPSAAYPDSEPGSGVTLKCTRQSETQCYRNPLGRIRAYSFLQHACAALPVHIVYGGIHDAIIEDVKLDVIQNASKGRLASVQWIKESGHMIPQWAPKQLAECIWKSLSGEAETKTQVTAPVQSKL